MHNSDVIQGRYIIASLILFQDQIQYVIQVLAHYY